MYKEKHSFTVKGLCSVRETKTALGCTAAETREEKKMGAGERMRRWREAGRDGVERGPKMGDGVWRWTGTEGG